MSSVKRSLDSFPAAEMARALFSEAGDALLLVDPGDQRVVDANPMAEALSEMPKQSLVGRAIDGLLRHEADRDSWRKAAGKTTAFHGRDGYLFRTARPDVWVPVSLTVSRLHFTRAQPLALFVLRDRRAQVETHDRLRRAEQELQHVLASVSDGVWSARVDLGGHWRFLYVSPVVERLAATPAEQLVGDPTAWERAVSAEDRDRWRAFRHRLGAGERGELEYRLHRGDRDVVWVRESVVAGPDDEGGVQLHGVVSDISARKKEEAEQAARERQWREAQRLESIGVLAGGLAHDFNNLLTPVLGYAGLAAAELPPESPVQALLRPIDQAARQAAGLCQQLLAYAGKGRFALKPLALNREIEEALPLLQVSATKKVTLTLRLEPALAPVVADATQIRQVLINLVANAAEALSDAGGEVVVTTANAVLTGADLARLRNGVGRAEGPYVALEIRDGGCGMAAATLDRIFEPFFSTKFTGRGLGLAAVLGIVRGHNGALGVESAPGKGTRVRLYLPASATAPLPAEAPPPTAVSGGGTVLVVDDEAPVRRLASSLLEILGLRAVEAADGAEALALFAARPDDFRFVLLDLTMPTLGGVETFRALQEIRPDVAVLLMSGFSADELSCQFGAAPPRGFLQKPFGRKDLEAKVAELLAPR